MSHRLTRRTWAALGILLVAIPALMAVFVCVWDERKYYLTSLLLVGLMFVPFVLRFEGRRPQARELVLLATMTALAVAGRAAFYWLPQCKPVCAIVILTAVAFTPEAGFVTGAAAGLISNFFFGQGPWTPWQMLGFGLVGFLGGVLFAGRKVRLVPLRAALNKKCTLTEDDFIPKVHIDVAMPMGYADDALAGEFALLEPFGTGNPRPLFAQKGLVFQAGFKMGANKTCARFRVKTPEGTTQTVVFFGDLEKLGAFLDEKYGVDRKSVV